MSAIDRLRGVIDKDLTEERFAQALEDLAAIEQVYDAAKNLYLNLREAEQDRNPETEEEHDDCRAMREAFRNAEGE